MSGKGSGRRPTQVDAATFQSNWDRIFSGRGVTVSTSGSNPLSLGSNPSAPASKNDFATYVAYGCTKGIHDDRGIGPKATMPACLAGDEGSIPSCPANWPLAQSVEQLPVKEPVVGSIPTGPAIYVDDATMK